MAGLLDQALMGIIAQDGAPIRKQILSFEELFRGIRQHSQEAKELIIKDSADPHAEKVPGSVLASLYHAEPDGKGGHKKGEKLDIQEWVQIAFLETDKLLASDEPFSEASLQLVRRNLDLRARVEKWTAAMLATTKALALSSLLLGAGLLGSANTVGYEEGKSAPKVISELAETLVGPDAGKVVEGIRKHVSDLIHKQA